MTPDGIQLKIKVNIDGDCAAKSALLCVDIATEATE